MFLNRLNKLIFMFIALFAVVLIDSSEVLAKQTLTCSDSDEYACAMCVYSNDGDNTAFGYIIKSKNGVDTPVIEYLDKVEVEDDGGYLYKRLTEDEIAEDKVKSAAANFISGGNSLSTHKLECLSKIRAGFGTAQGANDGVVLEPYSLKNENEFNSNPKSYYILRPEYSYNNGKNIYGESAKPATECYFPVYQEDNDLGATVKASTTDGKTVQYTFPKNSFYMASTAVQTQNDAIIASKMIEAKEKNQCPCLAVYCTPIGDGSKYVCTLDPNKIETKRCSEAKQPENLGSDITCEYKGMINSNNSLIVEHFGDSSFSVTYPDGSTDKFKKGDLKGNIFTNDCDDIFYSAKNKTIKSISADSKYTSSYVAQFCRASSDTEQYCYKGNCAIANAICGTSKTSENIDGNCPDILRLPIKFIKVVVFNTLQIFVPIFLILMGTIDFARSVMSSDEKNMREYIGKFIKRVLTAIAFFFITTIVSIVIGMFANTDVGSKDGWKACWQNID